MKGQVLELQASNIRTLTKTIQYNFILNGVSRRAKDDYVPYDTDISDFRQKAMDKLQEQLGKVELILPSLEEVREFENTGVCCEVINVEDYLKQAE